MMSLLVGECVGIRDGVPSTARSIVKHYFYVQRSSKGFKSAKQNL